MTEKENINESVASKNEQTTSHNPNLTQDVVELNTLKRKVLRNTILVIFVILLVVSNMAYLVYLSLQEKPQMPVIPDYTAQFNELKNTTNALGQLQELNLKTQAKNEEFSKKIELLTKKLDNLDASQREIELRLGDEESVSMWQLSEIKYLITLAQRKVVIDKDVNTAIALLKEADSVVVALDDPRAFKLRQTLASEINLLGNFKIVDEEKVLLQLNEVIKNVYYMPVNVAPRQVKLEQEVSANINDWYENLKISLNNFLEKFIVIRKVEERKDFIPPTQAEILKENIVLKLSLAQKAYYNSDIKIYKELLKDAKLLIQHYFVANSQLVINSLKMLDTLTTEKHKELVLPNYLQSAVEVREFINTVETVKK